MIYQLLVTTKEFKKLITFKYSAIRYVFAVFWWSLIVLMIYFHKLIIPDFGFINFHDMNILVFLILFIFLSRGLLTGVPDNSVSDNKMDEDFKDKIALIIACHNSEDVLPHTLVAALKHFPGDAIYIADNNKEIPVENVSKDICKKYGVNYIYTQVSNKTLALRNTVNYVDPKFKYLISMDDDTLFPEKFYINENVFDDKKVGCIGFGIRIKTKKMNLIEKCVDLEYKLYSYNCYSRNYGSIDFGVGIAYMMKTDLFKKCININPCDGRLPFGEDGLQGVICRQNGYILLQDLNNFFLTYCPNKLFICSKQEVISGYDAGTLWKQRPLRWYRSGTIRITLELSTIFNFNVKRTSDNLVAGLLRNLYYRSWKLLEGLMIFIIISFPFIIYENVTTFDISRLQKFLMLYALFPIILGLNLLMCKIKFRNKSDLHIDWLMILVYPFFMKIKFILNVFGFLSAIFFFIPFETYPGFYNIRSYTFKEEDNDEIVRTDIMENFNQEEILDEINMEEIDIVDICIIDF